MTTLYGIKNCDTVKKAHKWLESHEVDFAFHDVREDGLSAADIKRWLKVVTAEQLVNKRSTTWKQLPDSVKAELISEMDSDSIKPATLTKTLLAHPTLIKRPVLENNGGVTVGFKAEIYQNIIAG